MACLSSIWLDIRPERDYEVGPDMLWRNVFRIVLLVSAALPCSMDAKATKLREIYGPESVLSLAETQTLVEGAEEAFYRAEYAVAFDAVQRALITTHQKLGDTNRDKVNVLTLLGEGQLLLGDFVEADKTLTRARQIAEGALGENHPVLGRALLSLSSVRSGLGSPGEAEEFAERATRILGTFYGTNSVAFALSLQSRALVRLMAGSPDEAEKLLARSRELLEASLGKEDYYVGLSLWSSAIIAQQLARYNEAVSLCEQGRKVLLRTVSSNHMTVVLLNSTLADCYQRLGKYSEAERALVENLAVLEMSFGRDSFHAAIALNSLGLLHLARGNYTDAEQAFQRSLKARETYLGTNSAGYAAALNNLALIFRLTDKPDDAVAALYRGAAKTLEAAVGGNNPELATILINWSDLVAGSGDLNSAIELMFRSLAINRKAFGQKHPAVARSLSGCATLLVQTGQAGKALQLADEALGINHQFFGQQHPNVADSLFGVADVLQQMGCYSLAADAFSRSVQVMIACLGSEHPSVAYGLSRVSDIQTTMGQYEGGLSSLFWASVAKKRSVSRLLSKIQDAKALSETALLHFEAGKLHTLCRICSTNDFCAAASLGAIDSGSGKGLLEEVRAIQARLEADPSPTTKELLLRHNALITQLDRLRELPIGIVERDERRQELQTKLQQVEMSLSERLGLVEQQLPGRGFYLTDLCRGFPSTSVFVDFVYHFLFDFDSRTNQWREARYSAYLSFPLAEGSTNPIVAIVDLGEAAPIDAAIRTITKRMAAGQFAAKDLPVALQTASELVYGSLAKHLTNVSHLIICPDGQLSRLPFEMLSHNGRFLVEDMTISYVGSAREIVRLADSEGHDRVQSSKPLVMGNPDFDFDLPARSSRREEAPSKSKSLKAEPEIEVSLLTSAATRTLSRDYRGLKFSPLPGAQTEARVVAELLGSDAVLRLGAEAREADLKAVASPRVLHLATHGFFLTDQEFKRTNAPANSFLQTGPFATRRTPPGEEWENPMVRCGLALAGANHARQITNAVAEDGLLTGLEASLLNLQGTELVILSACDSGTGDVKLGEGVMSLRRAFRIAGAETVLASHWKVNDQATSRLMTEFMRRWQAGEPRAQAWREAQLTLLRSKEFANPFFWAAFTLTGQWK